MISLHVPLGQNSKADPGHAAEITTLSWFGKALVSLQQKNMQTLCLKEKYVKQTENNEGRATYSL